MDVKKSLFDNLQTFFGFDNFKGDQESIITNILDVEFPEFKAFFHNKLSDTALFLLNKYKTVDRMKRLRSLLPVR